jgi:regulation of enolase protein 1 (concanavalin A-like superfamily)
LPGHIWYRLSRRGPDFLVESSFDGVDYRQMRIFHLCALGETTAAMGKAQPPMASGTEVRFGLYACSPLDSSFTAEFSDMELTGCLWQAHS